MRNGEMAVVISFSIFLFSFFFPFSHRKRSQRAGVPKKERYTSSGCDHPGTIIVEGRGDAPSKRGDENERILEGFRNQENDARVELLLCALPTAARCRRSRSVRRWVTPSEDTCCPAHGDGQRCCVRARTARTVPWMIRSDSSAENLSCGRPRTGCRSQAWSPARPRTASLQNLPSPDLRGIWMMLLGHQPSFSWWWRPSSRIDFTRSVV